MSIKSELRTFYKNADRLTSQTERQVVRAYKQSLKSVRGELGEIYTKYAVAGELTYSEMSKYNRLNRLFDELNGEIRRLTGETGQGIRRLAGGVYQEGFYRAGFGIERESQAKIGFYALRRDDIQAAVQNPLSGLTLNDRLARNRADIIIRTKEQITQGLIQGESYQKVARRVTEVFDKDASKALRVVRTEAHRCQNLGISKAFDDAAETGVKFRKVWIASGDGSTRDDHLAMDGREADKDGLFTLPSGARGEAPGLTGEASDDINCRCTSEAEIVGYTPGFRRARGEGVIPQEDFDDWKRERLISRS